MAGTAGTAGELYERAELAHRRTDLQQSGTFELARLVLLWDQGRLDELSGAVPTNPMITAWMSAVADAAAGRPRGREALVAEVHRHEPEIWTSHGRLRLLAATWAAAQTEGSTPPELRREIDAIARKPTDAA